MKQQIRVEVIGKDEFWSKAFLVEWDHCHPSRPLRNVDETTFMIESDWLDSLRTVAAECNCEVLLGPDDPGRRSLFRQFLPSLGSSER
jgi:hypothetical protein